MIFNVKLDEIDKYFERQILNSGYYILVLYFFTFSGRFRSILTFLKKMAEISKKASPRAYGYKLERMYNRLGERINYVKCTLVSYVDEKNSPDWYLVLVVPM